MLSGHDMHMEAIIETLVQLWHIHVLCFCLKAQKNYKIETNSTGRKAWEMDHSSESPEQSRTE